MMHRLLVSLGVLAFLGGCAHSAGSYKIPTLASGFPLGFRGPCLVHPPRAEIRIFGPHATSVITGPSALAYYPARAFGAGKLGSATLRCAVAYEKAKHCQIEREDGGWQFGQLALRAATDLKLPSVHDGEDVQLDYQFMILDFGFQAISDEGPAGQISRCEQRGMTQITDAGPAADFPLPPAQGGAPEN